MPEPKIEDQKELLKALRESNEQLELGQKTAAEHKEASEKLNGRLDTLESKNQELALEKTNAENDSKELKEKMSELETKLSRVPNGQATDIITIKAAGELKAYEAFVKSNTPICEEYKYLRTNDDGSGGVLVPLQVMEGMLKNITEISPIRSLATVKRATSNQTNQVKRGARAVAYMTTEGQTMTESNTKYISDNIDLHSMTALSSITNQLLAYSGFNMESEITADHIEAFAELEGQLFVAGNGVGRPRGFLNDTNIATYSSGIANDIDPDALIKMTGEVKKGYNPVYLLNRKTLANLRTKKNGVGEYLFSAGNFAAGIPNQINGYRYVEVPDMEDIGAGNRPVTFGDLRKGYHIADGMGIIMIRNPYSEQAKGKVVFTAQRDIGGLAVLPEALINMVCES